jgi:hypothetical protein
MAEGKTGGLPIRWVWTSTTGGSGFFWAPAPADQNNTVAVSTTNPTTGNFNPTPQFLRNCRDHIYIWRYSEDFRRAVIFVFAGATRWA